MKVVDLQEYKSKLALEKQIKKLESISKAEYESLSIVEQKGYHNFMRLLKAMVGNSSVVGSSASE
tara:strand:+ start:245 stop:439 length:195 start_codon:yes stop_codon:yes gene_type:complete